VRLGPKLDHDEQVKTQRRRGYTRVSRKNQVTISVEALAKAGLQPGDELKIEATGRGRITLERADDPLDRYVGALAGVYPPGYLQRLRDEWER
jgi:bifunctional DNA-binding transcriptional regulator/antitoxin component of YhaV-PrlF toxin-antitoxin module